MGQAASVGVVGAFVAVFDERILRAEWRDDPDGKVLALVARGHLDLVRVAHRTRVERGDLVIVEIGRDIALRGIRLGNRFHEDAADALLVQPFLVAPEVVTDGNGVQVKTAGRPSRMIDRRLLKPLLLVTIVLVLPLVILAFHGETFAAALAPVAAKVKDLFAREDYTGCMAALSELRAPVDAFFDKIMVNAPEADIRANRLSLLSRLRDTMNTIADFSKTEG